MRTDTWWSFVEYLPGSLHSRHFGKALPPTRVSERMIHVGFTIQDRAAADKLYRDILGFRLQWYGGMTDERTDWGLDARARWHGLASNTC